MIDVVKYLMERLKDKREVTVAVGGQPFAVKADGTIGEPVRPYYTPLPGVLSCATLDGLVAVYRSKLDNLSPERVAFSIDDYRTVSLVGLDADSGSRRRVYARAQHVQETPFEFGKYLLPEKFRIDFQASFYLDDDAMKVLRLISTLGVKGEEMNLSDDGVSQTLEVKSGTVTRGKVELPSDGVPLIPWRTFREVPPVKSRFLLRIRNEGGFVCVALHEIDAKWRVDTISAVRGWIAEKEPKAVIVG